MRLKKEYDSVPSKDSEFEQQESSTSLKESDKNENSEELGEVDGDDDSERNNMLNDRERDEDETVVNMDEGWESSYEKKDKAERSLVPCLVIAAVFILAWVGSAILYAYYRSSGASELPNHLQFDDIYNGSFYPSAYYLEWSTVGDDDGTFIYRDELSNIVLKHIADKSKKVFLAKGEDLKDPYGDFLLYFSFKVSGDSQYILLETNRTKGWRHSYAANFWVFNTTSKTVTPLVKSFENSSDYPLLSIALWSPVGHDILYVRDNDLYLLVGLTEERRITFDGSNIIYNGIPDWVYEEEVLASNIATWWSTSGKRIAYLRLNDSEVPEFHLSLYNDNHHIGPYPNDFVMRYPKPGYPNPTVALYIYHLDTPLAAQSGPVVIENDFKEDNKLITELAWCGDDQLLVRVMNRIQDIQRTVLVDARKLKGKAVREESTAVTDNGWFEITKSMIYIKPTGSIKSDSYLDIMSNNGYDHIAFFSTLDSSKPQFLTSGEWEVVGKISAIDYSRELIYFISTEQSSIERHLYSVSFDGKNKTALTPLDKPGYYEVNFSPKAQYYELKYQGPDVPWQKVKKIGDEKFEIVLESNDGLRELLSKYELPKQRYLTVDIDGNKLNALEISPPNMDESGHNKYPVLFRVYGGPGSQTVSQRFELDWHLFLASASKLKYIVVTVDGRGTGFKGREFRMCVRTRLGEFEAKDQISAAKYWSTLPYVDKNRMAIWGWSFGGFVTSKVIEADSGAFQIGIAVAPVIDWRFYDSVYTERYMKTPELNPNGYELSAVTNMTGFDNAKFLLIHGTGDDNVHFQNSLSLIDRFTLASVHNYRVQIYTDSDHSIQKHNANRETNYNINILFSPALLFNN
nr:15075_t:CDS:10 [Entrophospora candida]